MYYVTCTDKTFSGSNHAPINGRISKMVCECDTVAAAEFVEQKWNTNLDKLRVNCNAREPRYNWKTHHVSWYKVVIENGSPHIHKMGV